MEGNRAWTAPPDPVKDVRPEGHCGCGRALAGPVERLGECRQPIEIPEPKAAVTEYRQILVSCAYGCEHRGEFPCGVGPPVSYGPRLKAYAVGLVGGHFVGLSRTAEIIADPYGVKPSDGAIQNWIGQAAVRLRAAYEASGQAILAADVAHFDESGVRVNGKTLWLPVAGTAAHAFYTIHPKRGREAMEATGLLPKFTGCAVHDHWAPYFSFDTATHSLCTAHILRELRYFEEATDGHQWPIRLRKLLVEGQQAVEAARAAGQAAVDPEQVADLLARYDQWVGLGLLVFWSSGLPRRPQGTGAQRSTQTNIRPPISCDACGTSKQKSSASFTISGCRSTIIGPSVWCGRSRSS